MQNTGLANRATGGNWPWPNDWDFTWPTGQVKSRLVAGRMAMLAAPTTLVNLIMKETAP
jgi:hypothetical protein